jgi:hypothetical protein
LDHSLGAGFSLFPDGSSLVSFSETPAGFRLLRRQGKTGPEAWLFLSKSPNDRKVLRWNIDIPYMIISMITSPIKQKSNVESRQAFGYSQKGTSSGRIKTYTKNSVDAFLR